MPKLVTKLIIFVFFTFNFLNFPLFAKPIYAAQAGINLINQSSSASNLPDPNLLANWLVYIPDSPGLIPSLNAKNIVFRLHAQWTATGKQMLSANPATIQSVATSWCNSLNPLANQGQNIYVEPYNELEQDYERIDESGQSIALSLAIPRAKSFITALKKCLHPSIQITTPAFDPQNAQYSIVSSAFTSMPEISVFSCHPYRLDTIDSCASRSQGKPMLFTEVGYDDGVQGAVYDNCKFIKHFCTDGFTPKLLQTPNLLAYFLFSFSPGNYTGTPWRFTSSQVARAFQGNCTGLSDQKCGLDASQKIKDILKTILSQDALPDTEPLVALKLPPPDAQGVRSAPAKGPLSGLIGANWANWFENSRTLAYNPQTGITERIGDNCSHPGSLYCSGEERFSASYQRIDSANTTFTTLANNTQVSAVLVTQLAQLQGTTPKDISQALYWFGSGKMASPRNSFNNIWDKKTAKSQFTNLESGSLARLAPYKHQNYFNTDEQISQRLCEILAGIKPDITIAYMAPDGTFFPEDSSSGFAKRIPNSKKGQGDVDRYNASVQSPVTVMASYLACYDPPLVSNCGRFGINLTPDVCNNTPALFKRGGIAGNEPMLYDSTNGLWFYLRMAFGLENASSKGFFEQCIQQDELVNCESKDAKSTSDWFGNLRQDIRDDIVTTYSGVYNILGVNGCLRCVVSTFYLPNTSSAAQQISLTAKTVSPYKYHQQMDQMANLEINLPTNPKLALYSGDAKVPLSQAFEQIDYRTKEPLWLKLVQTIKKVFNIGQCQPEQVTVEVNGQPVTASVCKGSGAALVYSRVYLDKSFQQQSVYTAQTVKQMLPYSVNQQISQALQDEGSDALYNKFSIKSSVTSGGGGSPQDLIRQGQASVDETDLPQKDGIFGKNTSFEQQVLFNQVLPYAWQQNL